MKTLILIASLFVLFGVSSAHAQSDNAAGKVFWRGSVDNKVHLVIREDTLEQRVIEGAAKPIGTFSFTMPMPQEAVTVGVVRKEGRSKKIKVIQQPNAENEFTAIVEIHDDGGGARDYVLEIFWQ